MQSITDSWFKNMTTPTTIKLCALNTVVVTNDHLSIANEITPFKFSDENKQLKNFILFSFTCSLLNEIYEITITSKSLR